MAEEDPLAAPDFAALFAPCRCGRDSCERCSVFQVTPRTAAALWFAAEVLAGLAYEDIHSHGDEPVTSDGTWTVFDQYPTFTWTQTAAWRRDAARAFGDVAGDLANGGEPQRTCPADEMALYLILNWAEGAVTDEWPNLVELMRDLPVHPQDLDWEIAEAQLLLDTDLIFILDQSMDGVDNPADQTNLVMGIGDFRPPAWFTPFQHVEHPRDPHRPAL